MRLYMVRTCSRVSPSCAPVSHDQVYSCPSTSSGPEPLCHSAGRTAAWPEAQVCGRYECTVVQYFCCHFILDGYGNLFWVHPGLVGENSLWPVHDQSVTCVCSLRSCLVMGLVGCSAVIFNLRTHYAWFLAQGIVQSDARVMQFNGSIMQCDIRLMQFNTRVMYCNWCEGDAIWS